MPSPTFVLPRMLRDRHFALVTPVLGAFLASGDNPPWHPPVGVEEPPQEQLPLTFWSDGHPLASRWYGTGAHKNVRTSSLFQEPVEVVLLATVPDCLPEWIRADVAVVAASDLQLSALIRLSYGVHRAPVGHVARGRPGLFLGHRWFPRPDEFVVTDPDDRESLDAYARYCDRIFDRILFGEDDQAASRLLDSIPGIRGERPDADR